MEVVPGKPGEASGPELEAQEEVDILKLIWVREQMKQQLMECRTAAHVGEENYCGGATEKKFDKSTTDLRRETEELKASFQNKTSALQRIQFAAALRNKVKMNDNDSRLIVETMEHIINLSKAIVDCQQQRREKEEKLIDIRMKRFSLKKTTAEKILQIQTMMRKQKKQQAKTEKNVIVEKILDNLRKERHLTTLIQNVFQGIIIGSRVNWAEDPSLKAIVLQLEKNPDLL